MSVPAGAVLTQSRGRYQSAVRRYTGAVVRHTVLLAAAATILVPLLWVSLTSIKSAEEVYRIPPTFLPRTREEADKLAVQAVKPETSAEMRYLFRLNVEKGSGKQAGVPGYLVGGKTGTAEKPENGRYSANKRLNSFLAAFPMDDPRYAVLVVLDEPKPEKQGAAATAAANAAPVVSAVIRRAAGLLGVEPRATDPALPLLVSN